MAGVVVEEGGFDGVAEDCIGVVASVFDHFAHSGLDGAEGILVGAGLGEAEVEQLEHGFDVLRGGEGGDALELATEAGAGTGDFAGEFLLEVDEVEGAEAAESDDIDGGGGGDELGIGDEADAAVAEAAEEDLVIFEVGGFEEDAGAVGELPFGGADTFEELFFGDLAWFRQGGEEGFIGE